MIIGGIIFVAIGLLVIYIGFHEQDVIEDLRKNGALVEAIVTKIRRNVDHDSDGNSDEEWEITYSFTAPDGSTQQGTKSYQRHRNVPDKGTRLPVMVSQSNVKRFRLADDVKSGMQPLALWGFGGLFFVIGLGLMVASIV